ncbi:protein ROP-like [Daphnia pulicaria]|uniref:protein ROP-like n=1 Tax=Daphnia pulicaria TaxID=35523 RepID=UPI001EEA640B|nr:protein ROP-like [Daphnia pulicaria]
MQDVIRSNRKASGTGGGTDWRILLVDQLSMRMVSACCKMHEIASEGITLVEDLNKKREPLPAMEPIYLITPCDSSVRGLMNDFLSPSRAKYKCAHVFFTEACAEELFNEVGKPPVSKFIFFFK